MRYLLGSVAAVLLAVVLGLVIGCTFIAISADDGDVAVKTGPRVDRDLEIDTHTESKDRRVKEVRQLKE